MSYSPFHPIFPYWEDEVDTSLLRTSERGTVPRYYTYWDITLETPYLTLRGCSTLPLSFMGLYFTPYVIIWYHILPTFYHPTPPYQYSQEPQVCVFIRLFFSHSEYDRLSVHTPVLNYEIRNSPTWQRVMKLKNS